MREQKLLEIYLERKNYLGKFVMVLLSYLGPYYSRYSDILHRDSRRWNASLTPT